VQREYCIALRCVVLIVFAPLRLYLLFTQENVLIGNPYQIDRKGRILKNTLSLQYTYIGAGQCQNKQHEHFERVITMINTTIKPFSATAFKQGEFVEITEQDVKGKWAVFFFYPADFTFVCPTELGDLADHYAELQERGVEVYSVSTDTHFTHKAWHDSSDTIGKINYYMVGDQTGTITNNFGVMREGQGLADRATFLVDPEGVIQAMEITAEGIGRDAEDLMRKVKAAQYVAANPGEVCPAKWKEGEETLAPSLDLVGKI
jgi:peroxiredoxin (alkyl hydroperoxide reductase subunit C)